MKKPCRIAALLPLELEYSGRLLAGAIHYTNEHRHVSLIDIPYFVDNPNALKLRRPFGFDAALVWATSEARWVETLLAANIPVVSASGDWPSERVPRVSFDSAATVHTAVDFLARRHPAVLVNLEYRFIGIPPKEARVQLFLAEAKARGIPARSAQVFRKDGSDDTVLARRLPLQAGAARRLISLLRKLPAPAAIWCGDDTLGLRVCEAAAEIGLRVPTDLAVLGLGNFAVASSGPPPLSTIPLPGEMIGHRAFEVLDGRLSGKPDFPTVIAVPPPPVIVRETTGSPDPATAGPADRARALMESHAGVGLTVRAVAEAVGLSPQALHDGFLRKLGHPPGEHLRRLRVATAKRHLADPRLSIARVAHLCGFNQQSKFSNFFRRETGISPLGWRRKRDA
jgi:DNA-binding LacI/PurR family transcriptional regulator/AraC-like DNA-binding protein